MSNDNSQLTRREFVKLGGIGLLTLGSLYLTSCTPEAWTQIIVGIGKWAMELTDAINEYRAQNGLAKIPYSDKLTAVALAHCKDLDSHNPQTSTCNLHSWSNYGGWNGVYGDGKWKGCCYPDDHSNAICMWDKPKEITNYTGYGYEISYYSSGTATAQSALNSWKTSSAHNDVILNKGIWQNRTWKALGAVYWTNYACAWFGEV